MPPSKRLCVTPLKHASLQPFNPPPRVAHTTRPCVLSRAQVYQPWIDGVMQEFFTQGDRERELGLPISMSCDRHTVSVAKCQVGFISFLVKPLFDAFGEYLPSLKETALANLEANLAHFKAQ
eukprot:6489612-Prymnesium_polylepis.3